MSTTEEEDNYRHLWDIDAPATPEKSGRPLESGSPAPPPSPDKGGQALDTSPYSPPTYRDAGINLPEPIMKDLGGLDAVVPTEEVDKEYVSESLGALFGSGKSYAGHKGVSLRKMQEKVAEAETRRWVRRYINSPANKDKSPPSPEEEDKMYQQFATKAHDDILNELSRARGMKPGWILYDSDVGARRYSDFKMEDLIETVMAPPLSAVKSYALDEYTGKKKIKIGDKEVALEDLDAMDIAESGAMVGFNPSAPGGGGLSRSGDVLKSIAAVEVANKKQGDRGFWSRVFSPFVTAMAGTDTALYIHEEGEDPPKVRPYNESSFLSWVDYLGRVTGAFSYLGTAAASGSAGAEEGSLQAFLTAEPAKGVNEGGIVPGMAVVNPFNYLYGWGSDEHLDRLSRGEDVFSVVDELDLARWTGMPQVVDGLEYMGLADKQSADTTRSVMEFAAGFGAAIFEPDLFSVATGGLGKISKAKLVGKLGDALGVTSVAKLERTHKQAKEVADKAEAFARSPNDGFSEADDFEKMLEQTDPRFTQVLLNVARAAVSTIAPPSRATGELTAEAQRLAKRTKDKSVEGATASTDAKRQALESRRSLVDPKSSFAKTVKGVQRGTGTKTLRRAEAQRRAAEKAGATVSAQKISDDMDLLKKAQVDDMLATSLLSDLLTAQNVAKALKKGAKASRGRSISKQEANARLNDAVLDFQDVREKMVKLSSLEGGHKPGEKWDPSKWTPELQDVERAYQSSVTRFNAAALDAAQSLADGSEEFLLKTIKQAEKIKADTGRKLDRVSENITSFKVDIKDHEKITRGILRNAPKALMNKALMATVAVTAREMEQGYAKLIKFAKENRSVASLSGTERAIEGYRKAAEEAPGAGRLPEDMHLVEQVELLTGWMGKLGVSGKGTLEKGWSALSHSLKHIYDPAAGKFGGPMSEDMAEIGVNLLAGQSRMHKDLVKHVGPAAKVAGDAAEKAARAKGLSDAEIKTQRSRAEADVFVEYITSPKTVSGSLMNTSFGDKSLWDSAKLMLRVSVGDGLKGKKGEEPLKAVSALAKMWVPSSSTLDLAGKEKTFLKAVRRLVYYGPKAAEQGFKIPTDPKKLAALHAEGNNITYPQFAKGLKDITRHIYKGVGGTDADLLRVNAFAAQAITQLALMNKAATKANKLLSGVDADTAESAIRLASGLSLSPEADFVAAVEMLNKLKIPAKLRTTTGAANRKMRAGLRMFSDDVSGEKIFLYRGWVEEAGKDLAKIEKAAESFNSTPLNFAQRIGIQTIAGMYRLFYSAILTGLFIPRTAYWTTITIGNFSQLWRKRGFTEAAQFLGRTARDAGWAADPTFGPTRKIADAIADTKIPFTGGFKPVDEAFKAFSEFTTQSLKGQTPLGKYVDHAVDMMKTAGDENTLAPLTNAMLNRFISALMDPRVYPDDFPVSGDAWSGTLGQLRNYALHNGVLTSFVSTSGLQNLMRRSLHKSSGRFGALGKYVMDHADALGSPMAKHYKDFADTLEQRQRIGLFADLIVNKGMTPKQAADTVKDAFYNWDYPMTQAETWMANHFFMFWNFQRRAMGAAGRTLMEPYLSANDLSWKDILIKSSPGLSKVTGKQAYGMSNVMMMDKARRAIFDELDDDSSDAYPWWSSRMVGKQSFPNMPMGDPEKVGTRAWNYSQTLGRDVTHKYGTISSFTPTEMIGQWGEMFGILAAFGAIATTYPAHSLGLRDKPPVHEFNRDVGVPLMNMAMRSTGPFTEKALKGIMEDFGLKDNQAFLGDPTGERGIRVTRLSDRKIVEWLDAAFPFRDWGVSREKGTTNMMRVSPSTYALVRGVPGIANEINSIIGPYLDTKAEGGEVTEAIIETMKAMLGVKSYRYDADKVKEGHLRNLKIKMGARANQMKSEEVWDPDKAEEEKQRRLQEADLP